MPWTALRSSSIPEEPSGTPGARSGPRVPSRERRRAGSYAPCVISHRPPVSGSWQKKARTDPGYVSRVFTLLEKEDLIHREIRGPVTRVDWQALIRRWTEDYSLFGSNRAGSYLEPRGLNALLRKLSNPDFRYAVTGSLGSASVATVAPARLAVLFVDDIEDAAERLALRPTEVGANIILAEPFDPGVYERDEERDGITYVAPSQNAADLLTSPGRGPSQAEELMEWMARNEGAWRS